MTLGGPLDNFGMVEGLVAGETNYEKPTFSLSPPPLTTFRKGEGLEIKLITKEWLMIWSSMVI